MPPRTLPAYWTPADQAELELRIHECLDHQNAHDKNTCPCNGAYCELVYAPIRDLVDWSERRKLQSKAEWLRQRHEENGLEAAADALYEAGALTAKEWVRVTRPYVLGRLDARIASLAVTLAEGQRVAA